MDRAQRGFTTIELMMVVFVIAILIAIVMPAYFRAGEGARDKACFANQRTIEEAARSWVNSDPERDLADLVGTIDADHPLLVGKLIQRPPTCPSAPGSANPLRPTAEEGAYALNANGDVLSCPFGSPSAHGRYY